MERGNEKARTAGSVTVIGLGAIGSHLVEHMARIPGVARLTIVDRDTYDANNTGSQRISRGDSGKTKVSVWAGRLRKIRPGLQVAAIASDLRDVPMGLLRSDLILSCVDSRLARQLINQKAHRLATPWIDAGIAAESLLARINTYMPSGDAPCLECPWDAPDYAALEVEYSCQRQNLQFSTGGASALGALAASLQALEAQKALRCPEDVVWGRQVLVDAQNHTLYTGRYSRNPQCRFDHRVWAHMTRLDCDAGGLTIGQAFQMDRDHAADPETLSLSVDMQPFVQRLACLECGHEQPVGPVPRLRASLSRQRCGHCDGGLRAPGSGLLSRIELKSLSRDLLRLSLQDLGLRPGDTYTISDSMNEKHFQIPHGNELECSA